MTRIAITGGPQTGKTTMGAAMAKALGVPLWSTDRTKELGWSEASQIVSTWFDMEGDWIIEGVSVPRALRKWLARNPKGKPCEVLIWCDTPMRPLNHGQTSMAKGVATVMEEIMTTLARRGVRLEHT